MGAIIWSICAWLKTPLTGAVDTGCAAGAELGGGGLGVVVVTTVVVVPCTGAGTGYAQPVNSTAEDAASAVHASNACLVSLKVMGSRLFKSMPTVRHA
jgi:hypothetical protein